MKSTSKNNKFPPEIRESAVRLVQEHRAEYSSLWAAAQSGASSMHRASRLSVDMRASFRDYVVRADGDAVVGLGIGGMGHVRLVEQLIGKLRNKLQRPKSLISLEQLRKYRQRRTFTTPSGCDLP